VNLVPLTSLSAAEDLSFEDPDPSDPPTPTLRNLHTSLDVTNTGNLTNHDSKGSHYNSCNFGNQKINGIISSQSKHINIGNLGNKWACVNKVMNLWIP